MTIGPALVAKERTHSEAGGVLLLAWTLAVAASVLGHHRGTTAALVTAFLLWRIWRGATWSRWVLVTLCAVAGALAAAMGIALALGAPGIVTSTAVAMLIYGAVGALLCLPSVRRLARS